MVNAYDPAQAGHLPPATRELIGRRDRALGGAYRLFYDQPVTFARGSGVFLYDPDGNPYLDAYNNVPSVGHSHPHVTEMVSRQLATLNTHTRYLTDGLVSYAERLLATHTIGTLTGSAPAQAMFTCTGSEANDLALRIARHCTGANGIIVTANAYHGVTAALAELSPSLGPGVPLGTHVRTVPAPAPGVNFTAAVAWAISDLQRHGQRLAAFLADSLFSSDGILPDPPGYLAPVAETVHAAGGLYIADEVQAGFGRTGTHRWGYQRHGIAPDIVTMGKPMGNGLPIAGLVARPDLIAEFGRHTRYFNTFGGNPVSIAAATAVLDVLETENLPANAATTGNYLKDGITRLASTSPALGDVRGAGLYLGIDVIAPGTPGEPSAKLASAIVNGMRQRHVLISATGPSGNVLKIRPPLPFAPEHADQFLAVLAETLEAVLD
jgi:4-aminobutyrate aminotransferase-like enzyme